MDFWTDLLLGATKPFRSGANILAKGYGDLYRGVSGNTDYVSPLEQYIREGITDEEAQNIEEQPYKEILKSGAGMAATLAPYSKAGLFTQAGTKAGRYMSNLTPSTNPLLNKNLQILSRGLLEGGLGGYGVSRRGQEAQDTILGATLGVLGEAGASRLFDKSYKEMLKNPDMVKYGTMVNESLRNSRKLAQEVGEDVVSKPVELRGTGEALTNSFQNYMGTANDIEAIPSVAKAIQEGGTENLRNATLDILEAIGLEEYPQELVNAVKRLSGTKGGEEQIFELVKNYASRVVSGM
jgi:hypothetical protein